MDVRVTGEHVLGVSVHELDLPSQDGCVLLVVEGTVDLTELLALGFLRQLLDLGAADLTEGLGRGNGFRGHRDRPTHAAEHEQRVEPGRLTCMRGQDATQYTAW